MDYLNNYKVSISGVQVGTYLLVRNDFQMKLLRSGPGMAKMTSQDTS